MPAGGGGRALLVVHAARSGLTVRITATGGTDATQLRDLHVVPLELEAAHANASDPRGAFSPRFLDFVARLEILRFAGWQSEWVGQSPVRGPFIGGRTTPRSPSQLGSVDGVALELCARLCLATQPAVAWFVAPALAPSDWAAGQAALLISELGIGDTAARALLGVVGPSAALPPAALGAGRVLPVFSGRVMIDVSAGYGYGANVGPVAMHVYDAWDGAILNATVGIAVALRGAGALVPGVGSGAGCADDASLDAAIATFAANGTSKATCASAPLGAALLQLRGRVDYTWTFDRTVYFTTVQQSFTTAMAAWPGAPPPPPSTATATLQWAWAFSRVDAFGLAADGPRLNALAEDLGFASPGSGGSFTLPNGAAAGVALSDAGYLTRLRQSVLNAEVDLTRFSAKLTAMTFGFNSTSPAPGVPRKRRFISTGGWALVTPDFGAVAAYNAAKSNVTKAALLAPAAALETALLARLTAVARLPGLSELWQDHLARMNAAGYDGFVGTDLMRGAAPPRSWGLLNRAAGNTALCEGWAAGGNATTGLEAAGNATARAAYVAAVVAASPALAAFGRYVASGGGPSSVVPYVGPPQPLPLPTAPQPGCRWGTLYAGICNCFPGYTGPTCTTRTRPGGSGVCGAAACAAARIGMNVAGIPYWSTQRLYRNEHFAGSPFIAQAGWQDYGFMGWSYGAVPPLTAAGYPEAALLPGLSVGTLHLRDLQGHYPAGTYIVRWDGDAVFDAAMDDVKVCICVCVCARARTVYGILSS